MLAVFVGPSGIGKTFATREWLLPTLLWRPGDVSDLCPERFSAVLIHDMSAPERPNGQYPGQRFADVMAWRRAKDRPRVACLERPSSEAMCAAAMEAGRMVLVFDEINRALPNSQRPGPASLEMVNSGRHAGVIAIGGLRRLMDLHTAARANVALAWFGNLADAGDRAYAADTCGIDERTLSGITERGVFLEWHRQTNEKRLIRIQNRAKIVVREI